MLLLTKARKKNQMTKFESKNLVTSIATIFGDKRNTILGEDGLQHHGIAVNGYALREIIKIATIWHNQNTENG
jgi:hypothetical protein